ncbi:alpha/beta fold hydrolase [Lentzea sp. NPDC060358]|uniref:alpha/beta fold hydrolase n=1 Tax=Lentzea sp. NPDC060358 TaxID=3347103 RepID=UPI0036619B72
MIRSAAHENVLRAAMGIPRLLRHPVWTDTWPDRRGGLGVVLVPGFGSGDVSLTLIAKWLRSNGCRTAGAHIGLNVGCTGDLVDRVERRLEQHVAVTGDQVVLLGHSRGGGLARLVAVRRPELVRGLVMMGSPVLDPLGNPGVLRAARLLARLSSAGLPGMLDEDCLTGSCYRENMASLAAPLRVPAIAFFSRRDAIAPWRSCLDPFAKCVEIRSTHTGMALDPDLYHALGLCLEQWTASDFTDTGETDEPNSPAVSRWS